MNVSTHGLLLGPGGELILVHHAVAVRIEPREHLLEGGLLLVPELLLPLLHRRPHRARPLRRDKHALSNPCFRGGTCVPERREQKFQIQPDANASDSALDSDDVHAPGCSTARGGCSETASSPSSRAPSAGDSPRSWSPRPRSTRRSRRSASCPWRAGRGSRPASSGWPPPAPSSPEQTATKVSKFAKLSELNLLLCQDLVSESGRVLSPATLFEDVGGPKIASHLKRSGEVS